MSATSDGTAPLSNRIASMDAVRSPMSSSPSDYGARIRGCSKQTRSEWALGQDDVYVEHPRCPAPAHSVQFGIGRGAGGIQQGVRASTVRGSDTLGYARPASPERGSWRHSEIEMGRCTCAVPVICFFWSFESLSCTQPNPQAMLDLSMHRTIGYTATSTPVL
jgi:hypothetical protein